MGFMTGSSNRREAATTKGRRAREGKPEAPSPVVARERETGDAAERSRATASRGFLYVLLFAVAASAILTGNYLVRRALSTTYRERLTSADYFLEHGEYDVALARYRALARDTGESAELYRRMANAALGLQKLDEARRYYEKAASLEPNDAASRYQLALLAMQTGDEKAAERWALEAARARATFIAPRVFLGKLYHRQGRVDEALEVFLEVLKINPAVEAGRKDIFKAIGQLYARKGNRQQAVYYLQQAYALDPLDDEIRQELRSLGAIMTR